MIMCSAACRIYTLKTRTHEQYGLWFVFAIAVPLEVLVFPLGYFFCFHPVGNFTEKIYGKLAHRCREHKMLFNQNDDNISTTLQPTVPKSSRISHPSYTFFIVSHPDKLSEGSCLIRDLERHHLTSKELM